MKPIKLIISAFGPYATTMPEINFEQFEERGLFLITGDTGAGKTTIFDAICFALFGKASGTHRNEKMLRSEYAKENTESFVDFYFSHQGIDYHVKRIPGYEKVSKTGTVSSVASKATLYINGKPEVDGHTQVKDAIEEILQVNEAQFKQIAMIAQGEFWSLLNASTDNRTEILRTIFMTDSYKSVEYKLKERRDKTFGTKSDMEKSILQDFRDIKAPEGELQDELQELQRRAAESGSTWNLGEILDIIDRINSSDEEMLSNKEEEYRLQSEKLKEENALLATAKINNDFISKLITLESEKEALDTSKEEIETFKTVLIRQKRASRVVYPVYKAWKTKQSDIEATKLSIQNNESSLNQANEELELASAALTLAEKNRPEAEKLGRHIDKLNEEETKYEQKKQLTSKLESLELISTGIADEEKQITLAKEVLKVRTESLRHTIEMLKEKPEELSGIERTGEKLTDLLEKMDDIISEQIPDRDAKIKTLDLKQQEFVEARQAFEDVSDARRKAERIIENNRAGLLAAKLSEGEKCPVCGSTHHPELAVLSDESVSEEEFKLLQTAEESCQNKKSNALVAVEAAKATLEQYEIQMRDNIMDCLENEFVGMSCEGEALEALISTLREERKKVSERKKENASVLIVLKSECMTYNSAQADYAKATGEETTNLQKRENENREKKEENDSAVISVRASLEAIGELSFPDWEAAKTKISEIKERIDEINNAIKDATDKKQSANTEVTTYKAAIKTQKENLEKQEKSEGVLRSEYSQVLSENGFVTDEEMLQSVISEELILAGDNRINDYDQKVSTNATQLIQAREDAKGKNVIDIEGLSSRCEEMSDFVKSIANTINEIKNRMDQNSEKRGYIVNNRDALEKARHENDVCSRLYKLVSGNTGNGKITLEQYIQAAGFDGIIAAANRRLLPMTDGQYELYRKDAVGKKSKNFLDLEVQDNYTNHRRPVGNLSGGESFKASLSLALGLSDTVSSNSGGIQMDALFIDEGFGTLDKKSIDNAMEILIKLSGSNKLVGIISHREELKENIYQRIIVTKDKDGSHIKTETGI